MEHSSKLLRLIAKALWMPPDAVEHALATLGIMVMVPSNAKRVPVHGWHRELRHGDHIIDEEKDYVVDMLGDGQLSLRLRTMSKFLDTFVDTRGRYELAVLEYSKDTQAARDFTARLALLAQARLDDVEDLYNLLGCNCDHFASWCRTLRFDSELLAAAITSMPPLPRSPERTWK
ncbi:hypothetical protein TSOC_000543 [Tetrabaena socialis]|uniref:LRAT domain-containing protein n=1 Tax=Tetrabaena socialis TaxID=47790 RepID=A0A2J8AJ14_9CHLO|nr:hypothetical protein TSOC_000543 [Tetrabaena socialis]|eukprot:PNH12516.1 hypothetical protein TSOC_000543 [Tetrabaena socialis]